MENELGRGHGGCRLRRGCLLMSGCIDHGSAELSRVYAHACLYEYSICPPDIYPGAP